MQPDISPEMPVSVAVGHPDGPGIWFVETRKGAGIYSPENNPTASQMRFTQMLPQISAIEGKHVRG